MEGFWQSLHNARGWQEYSIIPFSVYHSHKRHHKASLTHGIVLGVPNEKEITKHLAK